MENPQIGDIRINENGAEQEYSRPVLIFEDDDHASSQPAWRDTRKQMESQVWVHQCNDCNHKERVKWGGLVTSDEWFAKIAESPNKAPLTYIKECEKCLDAKYGKEED